MNWVGSKKLIPLLFVVCIAMAVFSACSNSVLDVGADERDCVALISQEKLLLSVGSSSSKAKSFSSIEAYPKTFKPNDKEYPYANIPRIVIETEYRTKIKDRETEIPAKLQIWGKKEAETEVLDLTIRGRGNTSWALPKKSYKIEFAKKQKVLGMPKDKDWALIANYADKTLMKNYLMYRLSASLNSFYAPKCEFAELYLNGEYLGVYLIVESIKIAKNRVNIPNNSDSYIVEADAKYRSNEQVFISKIIYDDSLGKAFRVHTPKNASLESLATIENFVLNFERFIKKIEWQKNNNIEQWLDVDEYIKHYWIQEFSKNPDAVFYTSVYFVWVKDDVIKMGPVWDFDLSMGGHPTIYTSDKWHIRRAYWNPYLFQDSVYFYQNRKFWIEQKESFLSVLNTADSVKSVLQKAAENNYKRWDILESTSCVYHNKAYQSYNEAVDDMKDWLQKRMLWIDEHIDDCFFEKCVFN